MRSLPLLAAAVALALALPPAAPAQDPADLPLAARQALTKLETTVIQAKKKAVADLTAVLNTETRAGRLKSANAVDQRLKTLAAEIEVLENPQSAGSGTDFLPGKWRAGSGALFTFEKGRTFAAEAGNFKWAGTWRVENGKLLVDSTLFTDTYDLPPKREARDGRTALSLKGKNHKGEPAYLDKLN